MARELYDDEKTRQSAGFCYSDGSPSGHLAVPGTQIQGFIPSLEMESMWKSGFNMGVKPGTQPGPSFSKSSPNDFYLQDQLITTNSDHTSSENLLVMDDPSLRCVTVFPCEGNERPSQGLSLSLSSSNPSSIGLQAFELRQTSHDQYHHHQQQDHQDGFFSKSSNTHQQVQQPQASNFINSYQAQSLLIRNSKYLVPAQELLNEFCSLGNKQADQLPKPRPQKNKLWEDNNNNSNICSSSKFSLQSLDFLELQRRKNKLLMMLEEVDKRYRHYCNQMKAVVSSFEAVAGNGAASVYSALASKAMSRHFRCLKDGILGQIQATRKAMGEKDPVAPGTTKGETPRLRILDQRLRQQRAFQQMSMMESHPWRPQRGLPERSVSVLRAWLFEHFLHPYPSDVDKHILARQTGLSRSQVSNWFINARVRLWKPMVEEMYLEETKEEQDDKVASSDGVTHGTDHPQDNISWPVQNQDQALPGDQKPPPDHLTRMDPECLSSIINNLGHLRNDPRSSKTTLESHSHHNLGRVTESFGSMELDFSSYNQNTTSSGIVSNGGGSGVSLTLGLQQQGGHGGSLAFPPTAAPSSLFNYQREQPIEDCQTVQYSLLDGEGQNLPYRNLMGAQLLRDLAG